MNNNEELLPTLLNVILVRGNMALISKTKKGIKHTKLYKKAMGQVIKAELDPTALQDAVLLSMIAWKKIYELYYQ